ncbi:MAG: NACHT domain-containing protein [Pseudomonadota bacterium]
MSEVSEALLEGGVGGVAEGALGWLGASLKDSWRKRENKELKRERWDAVADRLVAYALTVSERFLYVCPVAFPQTRMEFDKVYVPLSLGPLRGDKLFRVDNFPVELFKHAAGKCLVLDAAGMGKTTIGRRIFLAALRERRVLPFFVDLRRLKPVESVVDLLARNASILVADNIVLEEFLVSQNCLFILDGFDEISEINRAECDQKIRAFIDSLTKPMCFLTSRPDNDFSIFSDFERYGINSLNRDEAYDLIRKYGAYGGNPDLLIDEVEKIDSDAVDSFLQNPLLTSLLFRAFEHKSVVPIKRNVFYQQVFDSLFEAHDLNKEAGFTRDKKTKLHLDDMHRMLRALASVFHSKKVIELTRRDFKAAVESARATWASDLAFSATDFISDVTSAVPIFSKDGDFIKWSHKSLLDYFLAEFFSSDFPGDKAVALRKLALSPGSRKNFNAVSIIQELNPSLFNAECLLPAIEELIEEMDRIDLILSDKLSGSMRQSVQSFFACYRLVLTKDFDPGDVLDFEKNTTALAKAVSINVDRFQASMMAYRGSKIGNICLFEHRALLPIKIVGWIKLSKFNPVMASSNAKRQRLRVDGDVMDALLLFRNVTPIVADRILKEIYPFIHYDRATSLLSYDEIKMRRDELLAEVRISGEARSAYEF